MVCHSVLPLLYQVRRPDEVIDLFDRLVRAWRTARTRDLTTLSVPDLTAIFAAEGALPSQWFPRRRTQPLRPEGDVACAATVGSPPPYSGARRSNAIASVTVRYCREPVSRASPTAPRPGCGTLGDGRSGSFRRTDDSVTYSEIVRANACRAVRQ